MNTLKWLLVTLLLLQGCSDNEPEEEWSRASYTRGVNHTKNSIIRFELSTGAGGRVPPYGESGIAMGGGSFPKVWRPDFTVDVNWTVDTNPFSGLSGSDPDYYAKLAEKKKLYQKHSARVVLEPYDDKICGQTIHFFPCNQVKVQVACYDKNNPTYTLSKSPQRLEEPEVCP